MHKSNWNYPTKCGLVKIELKIYLLACKTIGISKPLFVTDIKLSKSDIVLNVLKNLKEKQFSIKSFFLKLLETLLAQM